jgi:hypothetical protein
VFREITDAKMKAQARIIVDRLTPAKLAALVDKAGIVGPRADEFLEALNGRREFLKQKFNL